MVENTPITSTHLSSPWIIDQILLADHTNPYSIVGSAGVGKTFLLIDWVLCCASSTSWFGYGVSEQKILFVRPDRHMLDFLHRAIAWKTAHSRTQMDGKGVLYLLDISGYRETAQTIYQKIVRLIHENSISLVVLDEWESLGISALEMGQLLQERFHVTVIYSLLASAGLSARSTHSFSVHSVHEVAETGELVVALTLPSTSLFADIDLAMKRVATPGMMVDSFGESCVVFQQIGNVSDATRL